MPEITNEDLETIRDALSAAKNYFELQDLQWQVVGLRENPKWSPLTTEVTNAHEKIEGVLKTYLLAQHDEEQEDVFNYDESTATFPWEILAAEAEEDEDELSEEDEEEWAREADDEDQEALGHAMREAAVPLQQRQEALEEYKDADTDLKKRSVMARFGLVPGAGGSAEV